MRVSWPLVMLALGLSTACYEIDGGTDSDDTDGDTDSDADETCAWDATSNLCWQHPFSTNELTWQEATDYCNELTLGGFSDWVLPSRQNFVDMLGGCDDDVLIGDSGFCNSCEESSNCMNLFGVDTSFYWTSSSDPSDEGDAWIVMFRIGYVDYNPKVYALPARCVRGGP